MSAARKLRRKAKRTVADESAAGLLDELTRSSLGFDAEQWARVQASDADELADVALARWLELTDLLQGYAPESVDGTRAQLETRRGAGFLARVAAMGTPAAVALRQAGLEPADRIRYRSANSAACPFGAYHARLGGRSQWIPSSGNSAVLGRRSTSRRSSVTGSARAAGSSSARGSRSKSSWFGGADVSALMRSPKTSLASRLSASTAASSSHAGRGEARGMGLRA